MSETAQSLARARDGVVQTLRGVPGVVGAAVDRLSETLARCVLDPSQLEASVRSRGATLLGGRIMIEQAGREIVEEIASALSLQVPENARRVMDVAASEALPLIAGWDVTTRGAMAKVYVNASDASEAVRRRVYTQSRLQEVSPPLDAPEVLGINFGAGSVIETKIYRQSADVVRLAEGLGDTATDLATRAVAEGAAASGVASWTLGDQGPWPRAFFIALRDAQGGLGWRCVKELPGFTEASVRAALPFEPGAPRSVGIAVGEPGATTVGWTLYYKPKGGARPAFSLEPAAIFRSGDAEVGVFVEPSASTPRAFARTRKHALSVRVREGHPPRDAVERLMSWAAARVSSVEETEHDPRGALASPPPPWALVE